MNKNKIKVYDNMSKKSSKRKILLIGRAGTGKSSIKLTIFEGILPKKILMNPLEPTRGLSPRKYSWLDLELGVFDSSGQEMDFLLEDKNEQLLAFENSDLIIYIFDYISWINNQHSIIDDINRVIKIINDNSYNAKTILFLHKIDLIPKENNEEIIGSVRKLFNDKFNLPIYFTSLYPELIYNTYNAFYQILSNFSEETHNLKLILDEKIKNFSRTLCFATNWNNSIVVQSMTKDFDINLINHSHNLIALLNQSFENMTENDRIEYVIISSINELNIIFKNLNVKKYDLKNIVCISQNLSGNKLIWLIGEIKLKLNDYIHRGKVSFENLRNT